MTEAAGDGRAEMEGRLIQRNLEDESFRQRMLEQIRGRSWKRIWGRGCRRASR